MGCPLYYDETVVNKIADDLTQWMEEDEERFWLKDFFNKRKIRDEDRYEWIEKYPYFKDSYQRVLSIQESRIFQGAMKRTYTEGMTKFALINNHNWKIDKQNITVVEIPDLLKEIQNKSKDLIKDK